MAIHRYNQNTGDWETWPQVRCPHKRLKGEVCGDLYGLALSREAEPTHYRCNRCYRKYGPRDVKILARQQAAEPRPSTVTTTVDGVQLELQIEGEI